MLAALIRRPRATVCMAPMRILPMGLLVVPKGFGGALAMGLLGETALGLLRSAMARG